MSRSQQPQLIGKSEFRAIALVVCLMIMYLIIIRITNRRSNIADVSIISVIDTTAVRHNPAGDRTEGHRSRTEPKTRLESGSQRTAEAAESPKIETSTPPPRQHVISCNTFDPNTVSLDSLLAWGIPDRVAKNLISYRNAGATYSSVDDLTRIYGMDENIFSALGNCATFPARKTAIQNAEPEKICINSATAEQWKSLYGIGDVLASRIVKFRDKLGGFVNIAQVSETYGLPPETFEQLKSRLTITKKAAQIQINMVGIDELADHPYVSYRQARAIVNYIREHGMLGSSDDLLNIHALDSQWIARVKPYLAISEAEATTLE